MQINWTLLTYLIIIYFAVAGFSKGWWREAITTVFLAVLVFLLQNPDLAKTIIDTINSWIAGLWSYIPTGITNVVNNGLTNFFAITTRSDTPFQLDPGAPSTWFSILIIFMVLSAIIGGLGFKYQPTGLGRLLGIAMGGLNGYILLSIAREYLDGRALPGGEVAAASEVSLVGGSAFGQPASAVAVQAVDLPNITLMDSVIPWIVIALGLLFLFAILNTRFRLLSSNEGRKVETQRPPFYR